MKVLHKLFSCHSTNCNTIIKMKCILFKLKFQIDIEIYRTNMKMNFAGGHANLSWSIFCSKGTLSSNCDGICTQKFKFSYFVAHK